MAHIQFTQLDNSTLKHLLIENVKAKMGMCLNGVNTLLECSESNAREQIGARWYIGLPSASYTADPGSNSGEGSIYLKNKFILSICLDYWACRVENNIATISQMDGNKGCCQIWVPCKAKRL